VNEIVREGPFVLCLVGGGQDGEDLAEAFAQAQFPAHCNGVILMGPFMPSDIKQRLRKYASKRSRLRVIDFLSEPALLSKRAERIVAMGGYNTICEVLSFEKRALIVPRVYPRTEQLIRALRLQSMGIVDVLHPENLSPAAISKWMSSENHPPKVHGRIDMNG